MSIRLRGNKSAHAHNSYHSIRRQLTVAGFLFQAVDVIVTYTALRLVEGGGGGGGGGCGVSYELARVEKRSHSVTA